MEIESLKLVCFSPTGTTLAICQGIARGMNPRSVELIDITDQDARTRPLRCAENEVLLAAVPVYMGRVPAILSEWLHAVKCENTPAVCVVMYGNRVYDDALLELNDLLTRGGCRPFAGAAFIGEHSFSTSETPTAEGRPDAADMLRAESFGRTVREKLLSIPSAGHIPELHIPGSRPYRGITELWIVDFIAVSDACTQCGACAEVCPVGAVDAQNSAVIDKEKCVTCCACIKSCPRNARTKKDGPVKDASIRLNKLFHERKEPEFFF